MRNRECLDTLTKELERHGIDRWRIERNSKHVRLVFPWNDREIVYVLAASPSDWRGTMNARAGLRKVLRKAADQSAA